MIRLLFGVLLLVLVFISLFTAFTIVEPGEVAVIRRFGRVLENQPGPGLYIGYPWGIDRVDRVQIDRVRSVEIGFDPEVPLESSLEEPAGQLVTGDHNLVCIRAVVLFSVNPDDLVSFVIHKEDAPKLIAKVAETVLTEWAAAHPVDQILLEGKSTGSTQRSLTFVLKSETQKRIAPYNLGILIKDARVTFLNPPQQVKSAFDAVTQAETGINTARFEAEQAASKILREAEANAFVIRKLTSAYAKETIFAAEGDAQNFVDQLNLYQHLKKSNPNYLQTLWFDRITALYTKMRQDQRIDLLDHHLANSSLDITQFPNLPKE